MIRKKKCNVCKYDFIYKDDNDYFDKPYYKTSDTCEVCEKLAKQYEETTSRILYLKSIRDKEINRLNNEFEEMCAIEENYLTENYQ